MNLAKLGAVAAQLRDPLLECFATWEIHTIDRQAYFLAQIAHESQNFTHLRELLNYKDPARLAGIFKKRFDANHDGKLSQAEIDAAKPYCNNPQKFANELYGNRMGNGGPSSGDGFRYCGRAYIGITGRDMYLACSRALFGDDRLLAKPELLEQPENAMAAAGWFWKAHGCNELADAKNFDGCTRVINPGMAGAAERRALLPLAYEALAA